MDQSAKLKLLIILAAIATPIVAFLLYVVMTFLI